MYTWTPTSEYYNAETSITISATGGEIDGDISATFSVQVEVPHFPIEDLSGEFGGMIEGKGVEVGLGPSDWNGKILTYEITVPPPVGTSTIVELTDESGGGTYMAYIWKPPTDANIKGETRITGEKRLAMFRISQHVFQVGPHKNQVFIPRREAIQP